jgi:tetratricopeptide (TPR) repeat protein
MESPVNMRNYKNINLSLAVLLTFAVFGCSSKDQQIDKYMKSAERHLSDGRLEKANIEYRNVLQIDPNFTAAIYANAQISEKLSKWSEAAAAYQKIIEIDDTYKQAKERLARLYFLGKAPKRSLELAEQILTKDARNAAALSLKGAIAASESKLDDAMKYIDMSLASDPKYLDSLLLKASILSAKKEKNESLDVLEQAIEYHPKNPAVILIMSQINADMNNEDRTIELLTELLALDPINNDYRLQLVKYYSSVGRTEDAERVLVDGVNLKSEDIEPKILHVKYLENMSGITKAKEQLSAYAMSSERMTELNLMQADYMYRSGNAKDAKETLKRIHEIENYKPLGLKAMTQLAGIHAIDQDYDEAERLVGIVLQKNPTDFQGQLIRGKISYVKGDMPSAIADLRAVLKDNPESLEILQLLAKAHLKNNEPILAKGYFDKALSETPDKIGYGKRVALQYLESGQLSHAKEQLDKLVSMGAFDEELIVRLVKLQLTDKDYDSAASTIERLAEVDAKDGLADYLYGLVDVAKGMPDDAIAAFKVALEKTPNSIEPLSALVKTRIGSGNLDGAITDLKEILSINDNNFAALNLLGEVYGLNSNESKAIENFNKSISINKQFVIPYQNLAYLYQKNGKNDLAIETLRNGVNATSGSEKLIVELALMYENNKVVDDAIALYEKYLPGSRNSIPLANNLAMLLANYKRDDASIKKARELSAVIKTSENPAYLDTLGWVEYASGNYEIAEKYLKRAVMALPEQPILRYHLGAIQYKAGNISGAKDNLLAAIRSDREYREKKDAEALLDKIINKGL